MAAFLSPTDIGSRAAEHCGQTRLDPTLGFADLSSKAASEIGFVYDKVRRAELQRNTWTFAIRRAALRPVNTNSTNGTNTMLLQPALWVASTTYFLGSVVSDENGTVWQSNIPNNLGNRPLVSAVWDEYFGPLTVSPWDTTGGTVYYAGELVYTATGDGTNRVYLSQTEGNTDSPSAATAWSATATYYMNQVVTRSSVAYMSLIDLNINQDPASAPALWSSGTTYATGNNVGASDGVIYQSVGNGNVGHDPTLDVMHTYWTNTGKLNPWTTVFTGGTGSVNWLQLGGAEFPMGVTITPLYIRYPLGTGPSSQATTRNIFYQPAGFLRRAPQDPKAGSQSWLGAPSGIAYDDWLFEGKFIVSRQFNVILLRFVADTVDVTTFDDMFCEGLGARLGLEICEPLTQSGAKKQQIAQEYSRFMGEARTTNAIEQGPVEPPMDDWVSCRL